MGGSHELRWQSGNVEGSQMGKAPQLLEPLPPDFFYMADLHFCLGQAINILGSPYMQQN